MPSGRFLRACDILRAFAFSTTRLDVESNQENIRPAQDDRKCQRSAAPPLYAAMSVAIFPASPYRNGLVCGQGSAARAFLLARCASSLVVT
jgi:hypothetical protein